MKLASDLPDSRTLRELMQVLHEEIGLPEHKTVSLKTSINIDLACNGSDAQHLMETLEQHFSLELADYDAYRYFQPAGNDPHLKRNAKGRERKVPLTIGMLYEAIKAGHWDTQTLEA
ncbi:DUF1493 family protein [Pseudomonas weihenstephanensis]|uniref:DUF1493 family protein n=1 Tax=Pseudomonas weihenstephanensis TaxID=1608994 RepID=UPI00193B151A|nr:DUF1493 family protein [Pseudomonas weihenstephanensis]MBM1192227.1 DUF1493 family protein [Pseudomonas weihenstephanensis]GLX90058.1 hypothetical protein Pfra02_26270 [Pseudomonas fragi]